MVSKPSWQVDLSAYALVSNVAVHLKINKNLVNNLRPIPSYMERQNQSNSQCLYMSSFFKCLNFQKDHLNRVSSLRFPNFKQDPLRYWLLSTVLCCRALTSTLNQKQTPVQTDFTIVASLPGLRVQCHLSVYTFSGSR